MSDEQTTAQTSGDTAPSTQQEETATQQQQEPEQAETAQEESQQPEPAQEESKQPETAQEGSQQPDNAQEESQQPEPAQEESQQPEPAQEESKQPETEQEESKQPETAQEESQQPEPEQEESKQPETAQEESQKPEPAQEESKQPETAQEGSQQPDNAQEESQQPETAQEESQQPEPEQEESKQPETAQEESQKPEPAQEESKQPETAQEESQQPETAQEESQQPEPAQEESKQPETEQEVDPYCTYNHIEPDVLCKKQTVAVGGDETVRGSPMLINGHPIAYLEKETRTLYDLFMRGLRKSNGGPCVGWKASPTTPFQWLTYQQVLDRTKNFGSGLLLEGARAEPSQFIGIFSQNRVEWKVTEQACNNYSMALVTLYETLGLEAMKDIIIQCELRYFVVDNNKKASMLLKGVKDGDFKFKLIVIVEELNEENKKLAEETGIKVMTFKEVEEAGAKEQKDFVPPKPEDLHTICYTSGTIGTPKGVMLTHANMIANHAGVFGVGQKSFLTLDNTDVHISYLPLAHVLERLMFTVVAYVGASIGFFQGDLKLLLDDVAELKPTMFPMVPRLMNKVYDKVWAGVSTSSVKKWMLERAVKSKMAKLKKGVVASNTIWDFLVFSNIKARLGGRVRYCVTGAAPISLEVINFMRVSLGIPVTEGYGQGELTGAVAMSVPGDYFTGSVGTIALCNLIKLVDVPEKNYFAKDGKGEICVKGPNIFQGYYKNEEKTKEALDEDGWLHSGDVGMWLNNGALKIIDRKKHIFKLAQGEYIAPEKIEQVIVQCPAIAQIFLYGESLKATLVAVVVPDEEVLPGWCSSKGEKGTFEELCKRGSVRDLILEDLVAHSKLRGLQSFEIPKKIHITTEAFSIENDQMTPTFKTRRPQVQERYKEEIAKLYEGLE